MRIEVHRDVPDSATLRGAWNELALRSGSPEVFYTHEWMKAVDCAYGALLRPWVLLAYEGEGLEGAAALAIDSGKRATFLAATTADYCDFLSVPEKRASLLDVVFSELTKAGIHEIVLANLPADSTTTSLLRAAGERHGWHAFSRLGYECARVNLGALEERVRLRDSLRKKKNLRYSMNVFAREGPVAVRHLTSWRDVEEVLPDFFVAHVARFLATNHMSNLARAERRAFLADLSQRLSQAGWLVVTQLTIGERPVAWNYGFRFHDSWFYYQPTFENRLEQYSPGLCLLAAIISEACDSPALQVVDLGLGAEGYKERFANGTRTTLNITLSRSVRGHLRTIARYRLAEKVKQWPQVESSVRNALTHLDSAKRWLRNDRQVGTNRRISRRLVDPLAAKEVRFYEWTPAIGSHEGNETGDFTLHPMDFRLLARAAMAHEGDDDTWEYLLRSAQKLKSNQHEGFVLTAPDAEPVHFCWIARFEGFFVPELGTTLRSSKPEMVLVFDAFTPVARRRRGHDGVALKMLGRHLSSRGSTLWAFSGADNQACTNAMVRAGFQLRYAMVSRRTTAGRNVTRLEFSSSAEKTTVMSQD